VKNLSQKPFFAPPCISSTKLAAWAFCSLAGAWIASCCLLGFISTSVIYRIEQVEDIIVCFAFSFYAQALCTRTMLGGGEGLCSVLD